MFSYVTLAQRIMADHPARGIRVVVDRALERMDGQLDELYSTTGRPSIAPERLLRASLLMALFSIRSERQLMEQMNYNLLFRWFVGLEMGDPVWDVSVFKKNRERLIQGAVGQRLLSAVVDEARERVAERGAFHGGWNADSGLRGCRQLQAESRSARAGGRIGAQRRGAVARQSGVDDRQGRASVQEAKADKSVPAYQGHALTENRNGLVVAAEASLVSTAAERNVAMKLLDRAVGHKKKRKGKKIMLGADTQYQEKGLVQGLRNRQAAPHVSEYLKGNLGKNSLSKKEQKDPRRSISQQKRKLIERVFGWGKLNGALRQVKLCGLDRVDWLIQFTMAAYNLVRMRRLIPIKVLAS